jgi:hypothetical protein
MSPEVVMPIANVIEDEIQQLIRFQIDNFRQPTPLTSSQLDEHHRRSEKIRILSKELDRIGTRRVVDEFRRSSSSSCDSASSLGAVPTFLFPLVCDEFVQSDSLGSPGEPTPISHELLG